MWHRLADLAEWRQGIREIGQLPIGYFAASTGGGRRDAAAKKRKLIKSRVSRGGGRTRQVSFCPSSRRRPLLSWASVTSGDRDEQGSQAPDAATTEMKIIPALRNVEGTWHYGTSRQSRRRMV